jgi:hypothetical protein
MRMLLKVLRFVGQRLDLSSYRIATPSSRSGPASLSPTTPQTAAPGELNNQQESLFPS